MFKFKFESYIDGVIKDLEKAEKELRREAAKHVRRKMKEKATSMFGSDSNLTKGVRMKNLKYVSLVGVGPPGYHAHLIEFGTDSRYTKAGKYTGKISKPRPFVFPTFDEEKREVEKILSEEWL